MQQIGLAGGQITGHLHRLWREAAGPWEWPWVAASSVLTLLAAGEVLVARGPSFDAVYLTVVGMTAPVAIVKRWPLASAVISGAAVSILAAERQSIEVVTATAAVLVVCAAATYRLVRPWSYAILAPFVINAFHPFNGATVTVSSVLLLVLVVTALVYGDQLRARAARAAPPGGIDRSAFAGQSGSRQSDVCFDLADVTAKELAVLRLMASGMSNREIADELHVATETVKTHVSRVLAKLGVRDRTQAVIVAYETGLVVPKRLRSNPNLQSS